MELRASHVGSDAHRRKECLVMRRSYYCRVLCSLAVCLPAVFLIERIAAVIVVMQVALAKAAGGCAAVLGVPAVVDGVLIMVRGSQLGYRVEPRCVGLVSLAVLFSMLWGSRVSGAPLVAWASGTLGAAQE